MEGENLQEMNPCIKQLFLTFDGLIFDTESVHTTIYQEMFELYNLASK